MKTEKEMAAEGEFLREFGKNNFVVASEALNIGRIKWNMVPIGKAGKGDIIFYMTTEQMLVLCKEIISGAFARKCAADAESSYPTAYQYATGEDASLKLNIGGGRKGYRIQMEDVKKKIRYQMGVSAESIQKMAHKYMLDTGMIPVAPNSYYASIVDAFEKGRVERTNNIKFKKPTADEVGESVDMNSISDEHERKGTSEKAPAPKQETSKDNKQKPVIKDFRITVQGTRNTQRGFYTFNGVLTDTNEKVIVMFKIEDANTLPWFTKMEETASANGITININGEKRNNYIMFREAAKK